jgi:hypothetical protein
LGVLLIVEGQRDNLLRRIANNDRRIEGLTRSMMLQAARIDFARSQRIDAEITEEEGREFLDIWKRLDSEQHDEVQELANAMREIAGAAQRREQLHIADR